MTQIQECPVLDVWEGTVILRRLFSLSISGHLMEKTKFYDQLTSSKIIAGKLNDNFQKVPEFSVAIASTQISHASVPNDSL
jgi:hypothetical protein